MIEELNSRNIRLVDRVRRRFNISDTPIEMDLSLEKGEIFRILTTGRGKKKSHCSNRYPKHEWELKDS
ncbi:MAG: hypothetical protein WC503_00265 [Candidatus Shapirobacteria bacterium]